MTHRSRNVPLHDRSYGEEYFVDAEEIISDMQCKYFVLVNICTKISIEHFDVQS